MNTLINNHHTTTLKKLLREFKDFAIRGNIIELAVGVIIGAAFSKIVSSLVSDILMPPLGIIMGGINFQDFKITLKEAIIHSDGIIIQKAVTLNMGSFAQAALDFLIIAWVLFLIIKALNRLHTKEKLETDRLWLSHQEILLAEIRDALKATCPCPQEHAKLHERNNS